MLSNEEIFVHSQESELQARFFLFQGLCSVSQETTQEKIRQLVLPILTSQQMELVDLEYRREGRDWVVRLFIDKEGGITLDDCAEISHEVGAAFDVEDLIDVAYHLEVSSPGLDRPLKNPADFERFAGRLVKVKTFEKLDPDARGHERKTFTGRLLGLVGEQVRIEQLDKKGGVVELPLSAIAKANLELEF